ncbi:peptidase S41 [Leptospira jelokensis]|uniref:Peptidase S41 n=1 Tax=Leptospira jelokensis TaxID=2484931 RepID=A0A4Z1A6A0_9LEPT|nr:peptidase S41 [Leptospira jelokensis]
MNSKFLSLVLVGCFFFGFSLCNQPKTKIAKRLPFDSIEKTKKESIYPYLYTGKLNLEHFIRLKNDIRAHHLTSSPTNMSACYANAIAKAYELLGIQIYPKTYYELYQQKPDVIPSGTVLPFENQKFIQIKQSRLEKENQSAIQPKYKKELNIHMADLQIDQFEFEENLNYIFLMGKMDPKFKDKLDEFQEKLIFQAMSGFIEELDPHSSVYQTSSIQNNFSFNVLDNISHQIFTGYPDILYIKIKNFITYDDKFTTSSATKKIIEHYLNEKMKNQNQIGAVLFDLRECEKTNLTELEKFLSLFIKSNQMFSLQDKYAKTIHPSIRDETIIWEGPIAILVGPNTKGGAELITGSFQQNRNSLVFGSKTFGQGTFQVFFEIGKKTGYFSGITNKRMILSSGEEIQGYGITPDIIIDDPKKDPNQMDETKYWNWIKPLAENKRNPSHLIQQNLDKQLRTNSSNNGMFTEVNPTRMDFVLSRAIEYYQLYLNKRQEKIFN